MYKHAPQIITCLGVAAVSMFMALQLLPALGTPDCDDIDSYVDLRAVVTASFIFNWIQVASAAFFLMCCNDNSQPFVMRPILHWVGGIYVLVHTPIVICEHVGITGVYADCSDRAGWNTHVWVDIIGIYVITIAYFVYVVLGNLRCKIEGVSDVASEASAPVEKV